MRCKFIIGQLADTAFKLINFYSASASKFFPIVTFVVAAKSSPGIASDIFDNTSLLCVDFAGTGGFLLEWSFETVLKFTEVAPATEEQSGNVTFPEGKVCLMCHVAVKLPV